MSLVYRVQGTLIVVRSRHPRQLEAIATCPRRLKGRDLTAWAKQQHSAALQARLDTLNAHTYRLYHLTPEEIAMVEGG